MRPKNYSERESCFERDNENDLLILRNEVKKDIIFLKDFKIKWIYYVPFIGFLMGSFDCRKLKTQMISRPFIEIFRIMGTLFPFGNIVLIFVCFIILLLGQTASDTQNPMYYILIILPVIMGIAQIIIPIVYLKLKVKNTIAEARKKLGIE